MNQEQQQPSEEELREALEAELKKVTVDDVLLQTAVSLINLGGRRAGLAPGSEDERDLAQVQAAIDAVHALLPVLEGRGREEVRPIRDALSQLQLAYAQQAGSTPPPQARPPEEKPPEETPPSPGSVRLGVPGQWAPLCPRPVPSPPLFAGSSPRPAHPTLRRTPALS